ncbi:hypothetical protein AB5N19_00315 [Seiridium cardinale]|uniref:Uncharacterized protein n=1 Tax=Seiridium cardinale TaxID=138064 RepID=A0ABR2XBP3_9PEZI
MDNYGDLPHIIEEFLRQVQKPRTPLLQDPGAVSFNLPSTTPDYPSELSDPGDESVCEDFFDWARWGNEQESKEQSAARSDSPSMPGLTSSVTPPPSEEGGVPSSPRDTEDRSQLRAKLREAKETDDRYTFPLQREIRPKHGAEGLPPFQLHNAGHGSSANASSTQNPIRDGSLLSPPSSRESSADRRLMPNGTGPSRGKRNGKLENADEVANCDDHGVCSNCTKKAEKYKSGLKPITGQQICFRNPFPHNHLLFPHISKTELNRPAAAMRPGPGDLDHPLLVFFGSATNVTSHAITISVVVKGENIPHAGHQDVKNYRLNLNNVPSSDQLCHWARDHTRGAGDGDFQAALDMLTSEYSAAGSRLPHHALLANVHELRCLYKIWSHKEFLCQNSPNAPLEPLPKSLLVGLRNLAKAGLKRLEYQIITSLDKSLPNATSIKADDRMALWVAMMQMILMYRDLFGLTESINVQPGHTYFPSWLQVRRMSAKLFSTLVVMCEVCFSKKKPAPFGLDSRGVGQAPLPGTINRIFACVEERRTEYFENLDPKPGSLEQLLYILRSEPPPRAAKRRKISN